MKNYVALIIVAMLLGAGCARGGQESDYEASLMFLSDENAGFSKETSDPFRVANKKVFEFNNELYEHLDVVSFGYRYLMPDVAEKGVKNFFENLESPIRITSGLLQGKWLYSVEEFGEMMINSIFSLGFAKIVDENHNNDEDIDQALADWGIPDGIFMVLPVAGPRYVRHLVGDIVGGLLSPTSLFFGGDFFWSGKTFQEVNNWPENYEPYEDIVNGSLNPYNGMQSAYQLNREAKINN